MREILLMNPRKKKKKTKKTARTTKRVKTRKTGVKTMAKKTAKKNPVRRKKTTKRRSARKIARRASQAIMGINVKSTFKNVIPTQIGMFSAKWAAKRLSDEFGATETDPESWSAMSYVKGSLGAFVAGVAFNSIKAGSGQKVFDGGINLMIFKALENEVINKNDWARGQFGADDYVPDEYLLTGNDDFEVPELLGADGTPLMVGYDGSVVPSDDRHRLPEIPMDGMGMGMELETPGRLGDVLEPAGPLGADPYYKAYNIMS